MVESDSRDHDGNSPRAGGDSPDAIHIPPTTQVRQLSEAGQPFSLEELREGFRVAGLEGDDVDSYLDDLAARWGPALDVVWSEDTLLLVAMVSDSARERVRKHAGWTTEELDTRLAKRGRR